VCATPIEISRNLVEIVVSNIVGSFDGHFPQSWARTPGTFSASLQSLTSTAPASEARDRVPGPLCYAHTTASAVCAACHNASFIFRPFSKMAAPVARVVMRLSTKAGAHHVAAAAPSRAVRMLLHASEVLTCASGSVLLDVRCVSLVRWTWRAFVTAFCIPPTVFCVLCASSQHLQRASKRNVVLHAPWVQPVYVSHSHSPLPRSRSCFHLQRIVATTGPALVASSAATTSPLGPGVLMSAAHAAAEVRALALLMQSTALGTATAHSPDAPQHYLLASCHLRSVLSALCLLLPLSFTCSVRA